MRPLVPLVLLAVVAPGLAAQPADSVSADDPLAALEALLDEPVQTAATYIQHVSEAPASVTILGAEEIDRMGHRTLGEALATVRGIYLSSDRSYSTIGVRGFSPPDDYNSRIAVLVDGVPVRDAVGGVAPVGGELGVPLSAVERIEVVRGPGSTLYGTGAMLAVVNVILKDSRTLEGVRGLASAGEYGAFRGEAVAASTLGSVDAAVAVHGLDDDGPDAYFPEFDAPETAGGVATGLDWERSWGALAAVQAGPARLDVRYSDRSKADPTAPSGSRFGVEAQTRDRIGLAALRADHTVSPTLSVFGMGSVQNYRRNVSYPLAMGPTETAEFTLVTDATSVRAEGRVQWDATPARRLVGGVETTAEVRSRYRLDRSGVPLFDTDAPYRTAAAYAQGESQFGRAVSVTAGARLDAIRGDVALSPRGAVVVTPDDRTSLKLLVGTAFRTPSTYERLYKNEAVRQIAAPDLDPERVLTTEATVAREVVAGLRLDASAFVTRVTGLIDVRETDSEVGARQFVNVGRAVARGVEGGLVSALGGWRTRVSYGFQVAFDPDLDDQPLTNAPRHVGKAAAYGPLGGGLWLSVNGQAEGARRTVAGTPTDPHAVVDAALSADVFGDVGRLTAGVRNAFDATYAYPSGFKHTQAAIPQRPRTAYVRLDVRL
jgi:iron complex outermembrane receptor protein